MVQQAAQATPQPHTEFDWPIYADATLAGLSLLIPMPFLDSAFEWFFRRRMPAAIARRRGRRLPPVVVYELNRDDRGCLEACLLLPITLTWELIKRVSRKLLYFLTIKQASDRLSHYWHRAFLLDYMLLSGRLEDLRSAQIARQAMLHTLRTTRTSPLSQLAAQVVPGTRHVFQSLRRARRGQEDEVIVQKKSLISRAWENAGDYLAQVAQRYDQAYAQALTARQAAEAAVAAQQQEKPL